MPIPIGAFNEPARLKLMVALRAVAYRWIGCAPAADLFAGRGVACGCEARTCATIKDWKRGHDAERVIRPDRNPVSSRAIVRTPFDASKMIGQQLVHPSGITGDLLGALWG